jgi:hypothetical protein
MELAGTQYVNSPDVHAIFNSPRMQLPGKPTGNSFDNLVKKNQRFANHMFHAARVEDEIPFGSTTPVSRTTLNNTRVTWSDVVSYALTNLKMLVP